MENGFRGNRLNGEARPPDGPGVLDLMNTGRPGHVDPFAVSRLAAAV